MWSLPKNAIDRTSPVPFYFQLRKLLESAIEAGTWAPGDRLPSEPSICGHFALSRTTVRQALAELESEGLVRKEKGRGTFVAARRSPSWLLQSSHGFWDAAVSMGHVVTSRVLQCSLEPLPQWAADALRLPRGGDGVALARLRAVDGLLVMYVINYHPPELADVLDRGELEERSLYHVLEERSGLTPAGGRRVVEAVSAGGDLADLLDVEQGAPLLFVEATTWDGDGRPFEAYRAWHRADRTKIDVQVVHEDVATRAGFSPRTLTLAP